MKTSSASLSTSTFLGSLATAASLLLMSAGAASATTVTIDGSYSLSTSNYVGNAPTITDDLSNTSFSEALTLGTPTAATNFFTTGPAGSCGTGCVNNTASENITATLHFTEVGTGATGSLTVTGTYEAKYSGTSLNCTSSPPGATDCFYWYTGAWTNNNNVVDAVTLSNGNVLDVTLYAAQDWSITPKISFEMSTLGGGSQGSTPLPAALPLFASGLGVMGFLAKRRKRKDTAAIAA